MSLFKEQRGVAEIIGFLIVTTALFGAVTYVLAAKGQQAGQQAQGLIDIMREAEARQGELISYAYAENNQENVKVYLFNYGTENVGENARFFTQGRENQALKHDDNHIYKDAATGALYNSIPPNRLVEIILPKPPENEFYLTVLTKHRGVFSWRVVLR